MISQPVRRATYEPIKLRIFKLYLAPSRLSLASVSPRMTSSNWRFWFIRKAVIFFIGGMLEVLPWREAAYTPYISGRCPRLETTSRRRRASPPASSMRPQSQPTCAFVRYPTCQEGWMGGRGQLDRNGCHAKMDPMSWIQGITYVSAISVISA
jgi:hypothetical protein